MCHSEADLDVCSPVQVRPAEGSCRNRTAHIKYDTHTVGPADSFGSEIGVILSGLNGDACFDCSEAAGPGVWCRCPVVAEATEADSVGGVTTVGTDGEAGEGTGPSFVRKAARLRR